MITRLTPSLPRWTRARACNQTHTRTHTHTGERRNTHTLTITQAHRQQHPPPTPRNHTHTQGTTYTQTELPHLLSALFSTLPCFLRRLFTRKQRQWPLGSWNGKQTTFHSTQLSTKVSLFILSLSPSKSEIAPIVSVHYFFSLCVSLTTFRLHTARANAN